MSESFYSSFQSRSGFSPCLDGSCAAPRGRGGPCFNPGLGFLPVETRLYVRFRDTDVWVSIPVWVFSLSRQGGTEAAGEAYRNVSIPVWVFSLSRPQRTLGCNNRSVGFQSRSGFSPCRDRNPDDAAEEAVYVSIPVWVFSLSRRTG